MRVLSLALLLPLALMACREETAALPAPAPLTAEAVGHFCQMGLLEHPGPKAQVHLDGLPVPLFFSEVRDAVAYLRMPEQSHFIRVLYVNDMGAAGATWENPGPQNWITADAAHFVVGSARMGGMGGTELVPFASLAAAEGFAARHGGSVLPLHRIDNDMVLASPPPAEPGGAEDFADRLRALGSGVGN